MPAAAGFDEPFLPDEAAPLPQKQEPPDSTRYSSYPGSSGPNSRPPPPANQGVSTEHHKTLFT